MSKPRIYVSMSALLVPSDHPDQMLRAGIAPYARAFMTWASEHGRVVLLTDAPLAAAAHLLEKIDCTNRVTIGTFEASKVEQMRPDDAFYWVDDGLIPGEVSWLLEHGRQDRLISVSMHKGVTPETKTALEQKMRGHRA